MKKILLALFALIALVSLSFTFAACDGCGCKPTEEIVIDESDDVKEIIDENGNETYKKLTFKLKKDGSGYAVLNAGEFDGEDLVIPDEYEGKPVSLISPSAFMNNTKIKSVVIGKNVDYISMYAFHNCANLSRVVLPESLTKIYEYAFYGTAIEELSIGKNLSEIGEEAFCNCTKLKNIKVDKDNEHFTSVSGDLYSKDGSEFLQYAYGKNLTSFTFSDTVTSLGISAFKKSSIESVVLSANLTTIGESAFEQCKNLKNIVIKEGVKTIDEYAFADCCSLGDIKFPSTLEIIGDSAFFNCTALQSIVFPAALKKIDDNAFDSCENLSSVKFNDALTYIGDWAFEDCFALLEIHIPEGVNSIGEEAFGYYYVEEDEWCSLLDGVVIYGATGSEAEEYANDNRISFIAE